MATERKYLANFTNNSIIEFDVTVKEAATSDITDVVLTQNEDEISFNLYKENAFPDDEDSTTHCFMSPVGYSDDRAGCTINRIDNSNIFVSMYGLDGTLRNYFNKTSIMIIVSSTLSA